MSVVALDNTAERPSGRSAFVEASHDKSQDQYADNRAWEEDRVVLAHRSTRTAWIVASVSVAVAALAIAAIFAMGPLRRVETVAIVVDKTTGASNVESRLSVETIPPLDALDMHNAAKFIRARERYAWSFLQDDYDMVARMSTPTIFNDYAKQFAPEDDLSKKFGAVGEYRISIIGVRVPPGGRNGEKGEAVVTFDKTTKDPSTMRLSTTRYVATVKFEYRPKLLQKERDRIENPFGFIVTAYRADAELTTGTKTPS